MIRRALSLSVLAISLVACASFDEKPHPHEEYLAGLPQLDGKVEWYGEFAEYGVDRFARLAPSITDDKMYLADRRGLVQLMSVSEGEVFWSVKSDLIFTAGPGVAGGQVLLGTQNAELLALDAATGEKLWLAKVSSEVITTPTRVADIVVVQTIDGRVSGLDASNGKQIWTFSRQVPILTLRGNSPPLVVDDMIIVGLSSGKLIALSATDGKVLWESSIAVPRGRSELERVVDIDGAVLHDNGTLYVVSYQGRIAAVTIESGRILWTRDMSSYVGMGMSKDYLYVTDADGKLWALDKSNGATLWMQDKLQDLLSTTATVTGDRLLVGDIDGNIYSLKASDGAIEGKYSYLSIARAIGDYSAADTEEVKKLFLKSEGFYDLGLVNAPQAANKGVIATYRSGVVAKITLAH